MTLAPPAPGRLPAESDKRRYVREMFSAIAPRYDFLNHLLSLGIDRAWRRAAVDALGWEAQAGGRGGGAGRYLDGCAGTLDLAAELARRPGFRGIVVGADFSTAMLRIGRGKVPAGREGVAEGRGGGRILPAAADGLALPFPDGTFDGATVGFGVRNFADLGAGLAELARVLKSGSRLVILEFTLPPTPILRALYLFYFHRVLPLVGRVVSGHPTAYSYLPASVGAFPAPRDLEERLERSGFHGCGHRLLTGGIAALHWGIR